MKRLAAELYLLNTAVLLTHEVDSAFWKEWEMFGLPGGLRLFLVLNLGLALAALYGFRELLRGARSGPWFAFALAAAGLFAVAIHSWFLATGHPQFRDSVSIGILAATLLLSVPQAVVAVRELRHNRGE